MSAPASGNESWFKYYFYIMLKNEGARLSNSLFITTMSSAFSDTEYDELLHLIDESVAYTEEYLAKQQASRQANANQSSVEISLTRVEAESEGQPIPSLLEAPPVDLRQQRTPMQQDMYRPQQWNGPNQSNSHWRGGTGYKRRWRDDMDVWFPNYDDDEDVDFNKGRDIERARLNYERYGGGVSYEPHFAQPRYQNPVPAVYQPHYNFTGNYRRPYDRRGMSSRSYPQRKQDDHGYWSRGYGSYTERSRSDYRTEVDDNVVPCTSSRGSEKVVSEEAGDKYSAKDEDNAELSTNTTRTCSINSELVDDEVPGRRSPAKPSETCGSPEELIEVDSVENEPSNCQEVPMDISKDDSDTPVQSPDSVTEATLLASINKQRSFLTNPPAELEKPSEQQDQTVPEPVTIIELPFGSLETVDLTADNSTNENLGSGRDQVSLPDSSVDQSDKKKKNCTPSTEFIIKESPAYQIPFLELRLDETSSSNRGLRTDSNPTDQDSCMDSNPVLSKEPSIEQTTTTNLVLENSLEPPVLTPQPVDLLTCPVSTWKLLAAESSHPKLPPAQLVREVSSPVAPLTAAGPTKIGSRRKSTDCSQFGKSADYSLRRRAKSVDSRQVYHGMITRSKSQELGIAVEQLTLSSKKTRRRKSRPNSPERPPSRPESSRPRKRRKHKPNLNSDDDTDVSSVSYISSSSDGKQKNVDPVSPRDIPYEALPNSNLIDPRPYRKGSGKSRSPMDLPQLTYEGTCGCSKIKHRHPRERPVLEVSTDADSKQNSINHTRSEEGDVNTNVQPVRETSKPKSPRPRTSRPKTPSQSTPESGPILKKPRPKAPSLNLAGGSTSSTKRQPKQSAGDCDLPDASKKYITLGEYRSKKDTHDLKDPILGPQKRKLSPRGEYRRKSQKVAEYYDSRFQVSNRSNSIKYLEDPNTDHTSKNHKLKESITKKESPRPETLQAKLTDDLSGSGDNLVMSPDQHDRRPKDVSFENSNTAQPRSESKNHGPNKPKYKEAPRRSESLEIKPSASLPGPRQSLVVPSDQHDKRPKEISRSVSLSEGPKKVESELMADFRRHHSKLTAQADKNRQSSAGAVPKKINIQDRRRSSYASDQEVAQATLNQDPRKAKETSFAKSLENRRASCSTGRVCDKSIIDMLQQRLSTPSENEQEEQKIKNAAQSSINSQSKPIGQNNKCDNMAGPSQTLGDDSASKKSCDKLSNRRASHNPMDTNDNKKDAERRSSVPVLARRKSIQQDRSTVDKGDLRDKIEGNGSTFKVQKRHNPNEFPQANKLVQEVAEKKSIKTHKDHGDSSEARCNTKMSRRQSFLLDDSSSGKDVPDASKCNVQKIKSRKQSSHQDDSSNNEDLSGYAASSSSSEAGSVNSTPIKSRTAKGVQKQDESRRSLNDATPTALDIQKTKAKCKDLVVSLVKYCPTLVNEKNSSGKVKVRQPSSALNTHRSKKSLVGYSSSPSSNDERKSIKPLVEYSSSDSENKDVRIKSSEVELNKILVEYSSSASDGDGRRNKDKAKSRRKSQHFEMGRSGNDMPLLSPAFTSNDQESITLNVINETNEYVVRMKTATPQFILLVQQATENTILDSVEETAKDLALVSPTREPSRYSDQKVERVQASISTTEVFEAVVAQIEKPEMDVDVEIIENTDVISLSSDDEELEEVYSKENMVRRSPKDDVNQVSVSKDSGICVLTDDRPPAREESVQAIPAFKDKVTQPSSSNALALGAAALQMTNATTVSATNSVYTSTVSSPSVSTTHTVYKSTVSPLSVPTTHTVYTSTVSPLSVPTTNPVNTSIVLSTATTSPSVPFSGTSTSVSFVPQPSGAVCVQPQAELAQAELPRGLVSKSNSNSYRNVLLQTLRNFVREEIAQAVSLQGTRLDSGVPGVVSQKKFANNYTFAMDLALQLALYITAKAHLEEFYRRFELVGLDCKVVCGLIGDLPKDMLHRLAEGIVRYFDSHHIVEWKSTIFLYCLDIGINSKYKFSIPIRMIIQHMQEISETAVLIRCDEFITRLYRDMNGHVRQLNVNAQVQSSGILPNNPTLPHNEPTQSVQETICTDTQRPQPTEPVGFTQSQLHQLNQQMSDYRRLNTVIIGMLRKNKTHQNYQSHPTQGSRSRHPYHPSSQLSRSNTGQNSSLQQVSSRPQLSMRQNVAQGRRPSQENVAAAQPRSTQQIGQSSMPQLQQNAPMLRSHLGQQVGRISSQPPQLPNRRPSQDLTLKSLLGSSQNASKRPNLEVSSRLVQQISVLKLQTMEQLQRLQEPQAPSPLVNIGTSSAAIPAQAPVPSQCSSSVFAQTYIPPISQASSNPVASNNMPFEEAHPSTTIHHFPNPDNFRIRLPKLPAPVTSNPVQPRPQVAQPLGSSSPSTNLPEAEPNDSTASVPVKEETVSALSGLENVIIDLVAEEELADVWLAQKIEAADDDDVICMSQYFPPVSVKAEASAPPAQAVKAEHAAAAEPMEVQEAVVVSVMDQLPPRIDSVDSGFSSPPQQMEHPEIMLDRICICYKKAEMVCQCRMAIYCSQKCQVKDWPNHQAICVPARKGDR